MAMQNNTGASVAKLMEQAKAIKAKEEVERAAAETRRAQKGALKGAKTEGKGELSEVEKRNAKKTKTFRWAWTWSALFFAWML